MDSEQRILMKMQREINYLIVNRDLKHLPELTKLLKKYLKLNNISDEDIKQLIELSIKYR